MAAVVVAVAIAAAIAVHGIQRAEGVAQAMEASPSFHSSTLLDLTRGMSTSSTGEEKRAISFVVLFTCVCELDCVLYASS